MIIKIMKCKNEQELEKSINKFTKDKNVLHIDIKPTTKEKMVNTLSNCEKQEIYTNEYVATIIYEN